MNRIELVPLAFGSRAVSLQDLRDGIAAVTDLPVHIEHLDIDIEAALNTSRRQYHSSHILSMMLEQLSDTKSKVLGITAYDLYIPVLTFIFGQAQLDNRAAIFSIFRLHNEFYGLPPSRTFLQNRALKEAIHELGHTFGLRHCQDYPCVMNSSTYVEEIDIKPARFCTNCRKQFNRAANGF